MAEQNERSVGKVVLNHEIQGKSRQFQSASALVSIALGPGASQELGRITQDGRRNSLRCFPQGTISLNSLPVSASLRHHMRKIVSACFIFLTSLLLTTAARAENPQWIWHDNHGAIIQTNEVRYFRKTFEATNRFTKVLLSQPPMTKRRFTLTADGIATPKDYSKPAYEDVTGQIKRGRNVIAIRGHNISSDVAGVLVMLGTHLGQAECRLRRH